jgi:hypothetical protein
MSILSLAQKVWCRLSSLHERLLNPRPGSSQGKPGQAGKPATHLGGALA